MILFFFVEIFEKGLIALSSLRTERAVTGRRCLHNGVGEDFFGVSDGSFHKNGRTLETKSGKIDPKVPK